MREMNFDYLLQALNTDGDYVTLMEGEVSKIPSKKRMKGKSISVVEDKLLSEEDELEFVCQLSVPECVQIAEGSFHSVSTEVVKENNAAAAKNGRNVSSPFPCDVTILVQGKPIPVHENILVAESRVFRDMIKRRRKPRESEGEIVLKISDFSYETVFSVIGFIYTGMVKDFDRQQIRDLLLAASTYDVRGLKHMCGRSLLESLTIENACDLLVLSSQHYLRYVNKETLKFIEKCPKEIQETDGWKMLEEEHPGLIPKFFDVVPSAAES